MPSEIDVGTAGDLEGRFEELRRAWWPPIRALMDEVLAAAVTEGSLLGRMASYHLDTGGKRLRAILPLLIAEALGTDPRRLLPFGAACEMLHNASLVHDDLQDDDSLRRGLPSVWKKFGKPQAINLGDAMIACTILLMHRLEVPAPVRERATRRVLLEMLRVIDGQVRDLDLKDRPRVALADYMRMVEGKTSRLFALPLGGAALLSGAPEEVELGLVESASHIGVLFQIQDDVADLFGDKGRERGNDVREGKRSVLVAHFMESVAAPRAEWLRGVLDKPGGETTANDVAEVAAAFESSGTLDFALDELGRRRAAALDVPALAASPALLEVLDGACRLFLSSVDPVRAAARPSASAAASVSTDLPPAGE